MAAKPTIPTDAEINIADAIGNGLSGLGPGVAGQVPAKVQDTLNYINEIGAVVESIRSDQPKRLEPYADSMMELLRKSAGLDVSQAADVLGAIFSSVTFARILGDVASGNLEPVASTKRTKPAAAKKAAAPKPVAVVVPDPEPAAPVAKPAPVVAPVVAPIVAPVVVPEPAPVVPVVAAPIDAVVAAADEDDSADAGEPLSGDDFDETPAVVETPAPAKKATAKKTAAAKVAAVPVPVASPSIGAGLLDDEDVNDDF